MRDKRFMRSRVEKIVAQENGRMEKLKGKKRYLIEKEGKWGKIAYEREKVVWSIYKQCFDGITLRKFEFQTKNCAQLHLRSCAFEI
jgi:hypothetical protein